MNGEQALFTSVPSGRVQGYQLVARSKGIDERTARELIRWGPSHAALCNTDPRAESINFHPLDNGRFVLSRTMYGGPEYSRRGGFQLVTRFLILQRRELERYESNPVALYRRARIEGQWQWEADFPRTLPNLTVPAPAATAFWKTRSGSVDDGLAAEILDHLLDGRRLAVIGCRHPLLLLQHVLWAAPASRRLQISFTTGLKPTAHRPFQLHFLPWESPELRKAGTSLGLTFLSAARPSPAST